MSIDHLNVLTFTTLYPNSIFPRHGIFIENRLRALQGKYDDVAITVIAPVPWFPLMHPMFGRYGKMAAVPRREERHGITILHPRYIVVPKIGMSIATVLMHWSLARWVRKWLKNASQSFDVMDIHYIYPDGVVGVSIARELGLPSVVSVRGSDINLLPNWFIPRKLIRSALGACNSVIAVSDALRKKVSILSNGAVDAVVARNGVDLELFRPSVDRETDRRSFGVKGTTALFVGNLIPLKGIHLVLDAMRSLPSLNLLVVGDGELATRLRNMVTEYQLEPQVKFVGEIKVEELRKYYQIADFLLLPSSREGMPNVVLESMACGTPVLATSVGGISEIIAEGRSGLIIGDRSAHGIRVAIKKFIANPIDRISTREWAKRFSWDESIDKIHLVLGQVSRR